jgi:hypothetical protein
MLLSIFQQEPTLNTRKRREHPRSILNRSRPPAHYHMQNHNNKPEHLRLREGCVHHFESQSEHRWFPSPSARNRIYSSHSRRHHNNPTSHLQGHANRQYPPASSFGSHSQLPIALLNTKISIQIDVLALSLLTLSPPIHVFNSVVNVLVDLLGLMIDILVSLPGPALSTLVGLLNLKVETLVDVLNLTVSVPATYLIPVISMPVALPNPKINIMINVLSLRIKAPVG